MTTSWSRQPPQLQQEPPNLTQLNWKLQPDATKTASMDQTWYDLFYHQKQTHPSHQLKPTLTKSKPEDSSQYKNKMN